MYSLTIAIIGLNLLAAVNPPAEKIEFKYVHPLGKTIHYRTTINTDQLRKMGDLQEQKFSSIGIFDLVYKCVKVNPDGTGFYEVSMPLWEEKGSMDNQTVIIRFEAGKPRIDQKPKLPNHDEINEMNKLVDENKQAGVDARFAMIVGSDGTPRKVQGYAESIKKSLKDLKPASKMAQNQLKKLIAGSTDESMLKRMQSERRFFPSRKILHVGETWKDDVEQETYGKKHKIKREWKLVGVETVKGRRCAKIEIEVLPYVFEVSTDRLKHQETRDKTVQIAYLDYQNGLLVQSETRYKVSTRQIVNRPKSQDIFETQDTIAGVNRTELISP
ncbi:MAG: DUF6263 family protein [Phycisphaerae bacterium]